MSFPGKLGYKTKQRKKERKKNKKQKDYQAYRFISYKVSCPSSYVIVIMSTGSPVLQE